MKPFLAMLLFLTLGACAAHKPDAVASAAPAKSTIQKPSYPRLDLSKMQPDFLFLAAQSAMHEGNPGLAIKLLTALVGKDSTAIIPKMQLIGLLIRFGRIDEAEKHIGQMLAHKSLLKSQREQLQLAEYRILVAHQQPKLALQKLAKFLRRHPANVVARSMQASILAGQGHIDKALASLAAGIHHKESAVLRLLQARLLMTKGDLTSAKISLLRIGKLRPDNDIAVLLLSEMAIQSGDKGKAERLLQKFLAGHPADTRISQALARLLVSEKRPTEAILVYRNAITHNGNRPEILRPLGILYFQNKDYQQAAKTFRTLLELQPADSNRFYLAASLEALGQLAEANKLYAKIGPASPVHTQAQIRLAAMEVGANKLNQAEARMLAIVKAKPQQLGVHLLLTSIRLDLKQYQQVLDETELLMRLKPLPPQLLFNRAVAFEHFKNYAQVEHIMRRVIARSPKYAEALNFLGYTYAEQGIKLGTARKLILRALQLKPDDGYYMDSLAWVYYKRGQFSRAAKIQKKALQLVPNDSIMNDHYGDILWRHGDAQAAREAWEKALQLKHEHPQLIRKKISDGLPATR